MNQKHSYFEVIEENNFYHSMVGECVGTSEKTIILEFKLNEKLGGIQKVQFFRNQVSYHDTF